MSGRNCARPRTRTRSLAGRPTLANLPSCLESSRFLSFPTPLYNWLRKRGLIRHRICVGQHGQAALVNELCSMRLPARSRLPLRTKAVAQRSYVQRCPNHSGVHVMYVIKTFYWISQSSTELRHFFKTFLLFWWTEGNFPLTDDNGLSKVDFVMFSCSRVTLCISYKGWEARW